MTDARQPTLDAFIAVSECLTGVAGLDADLAAEYLERVREHPRLGSGLQALAARYQAFIAPLLSRPDGSRVTDRQREQAETAAGEQLMADPDLGPVACQLIYLWYAGALFEADPATPGRSAWDYGANPEHYGRGLMWSVIRAHAPMTPMPDTPPDPRHAPSEAPGDPEPYWTRPPDTTRPVALPPRWFDP